MMQREKVRIAIIGLGNMGKRYAQMLNRGDVPNMELTCVCIHREDGRRWVEENLNPGIRITVGMEELFSHESEFDALLIAVPHKEHMQLAMRAYEYGKHVFCEKPAGIKVEEARRMMEEALNRGLQYALMFHHRQYDCYQRLKQMIDAHELGRILRIDQENCMYRTRYYHESGKWRSSWSGEGGGLLINQGQHVLDMWQWLFGMPECIRADIEYGKYNDFSVDDEVTIQMKYQDGRNARLFMTTGEPVEGERLVVVGSKGKIVLQGNVMTQYRFSRDSIEYGASAQVIGTQELDCCQWEELFPEKYELAYEKMLKNFADSIIDGIPLAASGEAGLLALELANGAYLSSWLEDWITLPIDGSLYERKLCEAIHREETGI